MSSNEKRVPKVRFKGFSGDWEQRKLKEVGSVAMCKRIFKEQTNENGEVPFYKIGTFGGTPDSFIDRELFNQYVEKFPYPEVGDILISASGTIGRTVVYKGEEAYFQDSNIVWFKRDKKVLLNIFLEQFYKIVKWYGIEGTTIKRLYNSNILNTTISLPSIEEQMKIGYFLKKIDDTIALHQEKLSKLKQLKSGYLQVMFPQKREGIPRLRFANFKGNWEQRKLEGFVDFYSGLTYSPEDIVVKGTLVLRSSNVQNGEIVNADNVYVNPKVVNSQNVELGDIIVVVRNGSRNLIGKHASIKREMSNTVIGAFMTGVRSSIPSFINALLDTRQFSIEIHKNLGATINQITIGTFKKMKFTIPSQDEQLEIGNFFEQLDNTIALQQVKIEKLQALKKVYLQKMFI